MKAVDIPLFNAQILGPLVNYLEQHGVKASRYLDRVRVPGEIIESGGWITKKQAYDFVIHVVRGERYPGIVFDSYVDFQVEQLGPIADAMRSCKTVKQALDAATRLASMAYEQNEYFLKIEGETTWFSYREAKTISDGGEFINDMTMAVYNQVIRFVVDECWRPQELRIPGTAMNRDGIVDGFEDCATSRHPGTSAIAFPTEFLSRRLPWDQSQTEFDANNAWNFDSDWRDGTMKSLGRIIASRFPYRGLPTLDLVATIFDISPATLKRQLAAAGISYRQLLDRIRFDAACEMLSTPQISIKEISQELGYSGTNNFVRGFRRMTGMTPGAFRSRKLDC